MRKLLEAHWWLMTCLAFFVWHWQHFTQRANRAGTHLNNWHQTRSSQELDEWAKCNDEKCHPSTTVVVSCSLAQVGIHTACLYLHTCMLYCFSNRCCSTQLRFSGRGEKALSPHSVEGSVTCVRLDHVFPADRPAVTLESPSSSLSRIDYIVGWSPSV